MQSWLIHWCILNLSICLNLSVYFQYKRTFIYKNLLLYYYYIIINIFLLAGDLNHLMTILPEIHRPSSAPFGIFQRWTGGWCWCRWIGRRTSRPGRWWRERSRNASRGPGFEPEIRKYKSFAAFPLFLISIVTLLDRNRIFLQFLEIERGGL